MSQFVSFALLMSIALFALALATQLLAWGWESTALQVLKLKTTSNLLTKQRARVHAWGWKNITCILKASFVASLLVATIAYGMGVGAVPYTQVGPTLNDNCFSSELLSTVQFSFPIPGGGVVHPRASYSWILPRPASQVKLDAKLLHISTRSVSI